MREILRGQSCVGGEKRYPSVRLGSATTSRIGAAGQGRGELQGAKLLRGEEAKSELAGMPNHLAQGGWEEGEVLNGNEQDVGEEDEGESEEEEDSSSEEGDSGASPHWIDPDLLEVKNEHCVCALCFGVMVEPTSGCPEGHTFCRACYDKALHRKLQCPTCREPTYQHTLVRSRALEGMISQLLMHCEHAGGWGGDEASGKPAAKRARLAPSASLTVEALRKELRQRGLQTSEGKTILVARLEEDRKKGAGCGWRGRVGQLAAHLGECVWELVTCPNTGCTESMLPKDLPEHGAKCEHRKVPCRHCTKGVSFRCLVEHEGRCQAAEIECPNEGCSVLQCRGCMNRHRAICQEEEITCPRPGCDARLLRKKMNAHVKKRHLKKAEQQLQRAWAEVAWLKAFSESEQRCAAAAPTSWVFNWRAEGWGLGEYVSETHDYGEGVSGYCLLNGSLDPKHSHFIGFGIEGPKKCRVHAKFSILDKDDKTLRNIHELGTAAAPDEREFEDDSFWGTEFTPTAEEKAQSVRADGSIRLRAVARLFLDSAA